MTKLYSRREIYRLNLEQGQFMPSLVTKAESLNCCEFNSYHQLFVCGTSETTVEAWDYRSNQRVGILDCALEELDEEITLSSEYVILYFALSCCYLIHLL